LDKDADGIVTYKEFRDGFKHLPTPDANKLFQEADTDGDGFISQNEYKNWVRSANAKTYTFLILITNKAANQLRLFHIVVRQSISFGRQYHIAKQFTKA